jgi:drug/metabolite transporter (DMT)-like permease
MPAAAPTLRAVIVVEPEFVRTRPAMATTQERHALLQIHFCVVLWGFTAILGKLISLPALDLVWWRMLIVVLVLTAWPPLWRELRRADPATLAVFGGIGVLVALHWLTFYGAIKLSNASVAASCMAVGPLFLAVVEPWIARRPFDARELVVGIVALPGVALVVGGTPSGMQAGLAVGILSAFLVAIFGSLNKRYVERGSPLLVTAVELAAGVVFLTVVSLAWHGSGPWTPLPHGRDTWLLAALALGCTLLPFALALRALRHTSAFTAQLAVSLEPVYAIVLAIVLLGEQRELTAAFYAGVALILFAVFAHTWFKLRGTRA